MTYVDRIDSQVHRCVHDLPVTKVENIGVSIFLHPDGKPCLLLNSLKLDMDTVNAEDLNLQRAKANGKSVLESLVDPIIYSRLTVDRELSKRLADELDHEKDMKKIEAGFLAIARGKNAPEVFRTIGSVLGPAKNEIVMWNVAAVYGRHYATEDLRHLVSLITEYQPALEKRAKELAAGVKKP